MNISNNEMMKKLKELREGKLFKLWVYLSVAEKPCPKEAKECGIGSTSYETGIDKLVEMGYEVPQSVIRNKRIGYKKREKSE